MRPLLAAGSTRPRVPAHAVPRRLLGALAALALAGLGTVTAGTAAHAASGVFVTVNPSTVAVGKSVGITASCGEDVNDATVTSDAFDSKVTLTPMNGMLSATAAVPATTAPQGYTVTLTCASGNTATTTLWVVDNTAPSAGPATGGGGSAQRGGTLVAVGLAVLLCGGVVAVAAVRRRREPAPLR
jgi:hypothetical protein